MITLKASREELSAAQQVASVAQLKDIQLQQVALENAIPEQASDEEVVLRVRFSETKSDYVVGTGTLLVKCGVIVEFFRDDSSTGTNPLDADVLVSLRVEFALRYAIPSEPIPEPVLERGLKAFSRLNGPYNCWPYLRQQVHAITGSMGLDFMLPLLRIEPTGSGPEGEENSEQEG